jgi:hypothetical protein
MPSVSRRSIRPAIRWEACEEIPAHECGDGAHGFAADNSGNRRPAGSRRDRCISYTRRNVKEASPWIGVEARD